MSVWTTFKAYGAQGLAALLTLYLAIDGAMGCELADWVGWDNKQWIAFGLSSALLAHVVFLRHPAAQPPTVGPPPSGQSGNVHVAFLLVLLVLAIIAIACTVTRAPLLKPAPPRERVYRSVPCPVAGDLQDVATRMCV